MKALLLSLLLSVTLFAVDFSPKTAVFTANPMASRILFDGHIGENEYAGCMENFGLLGVDSPLLAGRQGSFFAAMDKEYLYLACRSELPDVEGLQLLDRYTKRDSAVGEDDCVEFLVKLLRGQYVYHIMVNPSGKVHDVRYAVNDDVIDSETPIEWNPPLETRSHVGDKYWELEIRIPRYSLNLADFGRTEVFKMQFGRRWRFPDEQCLLTQSSAAVRLDGMCTVRFVPDAPAVRFVKMGNYRSGDHAIHFVMDNPTQSFHTLAYSVNVVSEGLPHIAEGVIRVAPMSSVPVDVEFDCKDALDYEMNVRFSDKSSGDLLYQRSLEWRYPAPSRWKKTERKDDLPLELGVYPYFNLLRARIGNREQPAEFQKVTAVSFQLTDEAGNALAKPVAGHAVENVGYMADFPLNLNEKGVYCVVARITGINGNVQLKKQAFLFEKFPWEHNALGKERVVLHPYVPLKYGESSVGTLMGEYCFMDGFFSSIRMGKAQNLLQGPVRLIVDGRPLMQHSLQWGEKADDQGNVTMVCRDDKATYVVTHHVEFDNFIKTSLRIEPKGIAEIASMVLDIPLQTNFAQMLHTTCDTMKENATLNFAGKKDGVLWDSRQGTLNPSVSNNFRPYIWVGNMAEGLAFFAANDRHWGRNPDLPMAELVRNRDTTSLRIHLVDTPISYGSPVTIVFGFQATPTRPRPSQYQRLTERFKAPHSTVIASLAGGVCWSCENYDFFPKNHDYSFVNAIVMAKQKRNDKGYQEMVCEAFLQKHFAQYPTTHQSYVRRQLQRGFTYANMSHFLMPYLNPRASQLYWPEYQVFMDEWYCSQFRANKESSDNNSPVPSYQDYMLHCMQRLLLEGMDGLYLDNIHDVQSPNTVTGPAYELANGKIQPYFDLFDMRDLIKRTAIMLQQTKKTLVDKRPFLALQQTNANIVPFSSLGTIGVDMDAHYGSGDFQDRFSEDYIKICTLGLQSGIAPEICIRISGDDREHATRSFLAVTLAYDLPLVMNSGGLTPTWLKTWMLLKKWGYGTPKVKTYPCFAPSGNFVCSSKNVRMTEYRHKDGSIMLAIASFGAEGKVHVRLPEEYVSVQNAETEIEVPVSANGICSVILKHNEFLLLSIKKQEL